MTSALRITGLKKSYKSAPDALKGIDLEVAAGEFFAILGPNGAGKSTLINSIAQTITKTSGTIEIFGTSIDDDPQGTKMQIGIMPQEIALDTFFTVEELLSIHSGYYGIADNSDYIEYLLKKVSLWGQRKKKVGTLSGGMKRRLMVAKALVHKPKLLILDEPTAGVDVELRHELWEFVKELNTSGMTIILTTHYLEEAQQLAKRVAIIDCGKVIACDETKKLLKDFGVRKFSFTQHSHLVLPDFLQPFSKGDHEVSGEFSGEVAKKLFSWLTDNTNHIDNLVIEEASLEEVFLKLTGDK